jgi:putative transposase
MARSPRLVVPGLPHHVTQRGVRRQNTFLDDNDYKTYLRLAAELLAEAPVEIWAYCLMPNHMHAVIVPKTADGLASFFKALHQRYARITNLKYDWQGHLWQARFYSVPMNEVHTYIALRYVELNPLRAGLVGAPEDWAWSSTRANLELEESDLVAREKTRGLVPDWAEFLAQGLSEEDMRNLRHQTRTGQPDD